MSQAVFCPRPDPAQQAVLAHREGAMLVLGAAGTGKTSLACEVAISRVRDRGIDPHRILFLTFSRTAARTTADRLATGLERVGASIPVLSVHGFAHAMARQIPTEDGRRVLTAPEQEFRLREIVAGSALPWPDDLAGAVHTRAFSQDLRALLARCRQVGLDPADLARLGQECDRPGWVRAAHLFEEYLDILDMEQVIDYDELIHRVLIEFADPVTGPVLRDQWSCVIVDDLHDAVPAHLRLLTAVAPPGSGTELIATANPDQSVLSFRGAPHDITSRFLTATTVPGIRPPQVQVLDTDHRHAPPVAGVLQATLAPLPVLVDLPAWRETTCALTAPAAPPGRAGTDRTGHRVGEDPGVEPDASVLVASSERGQAANMATYLLDARERLGLAWSDMAVIVRRHGAEAAALRRRLQRWGIPVASEDDTPLSQEPAVRVLLDIVELAIAEPDTPLPDAVLTGPLGRVDAMALRQHRQSVQAGGPGRADVTAAIATLHGVLEATRERVADEAPALEVLWAAWSATSWGADLQQTVLGAGPDAARADRDLDAIMALFDFAGRSGARRGRAGVADLLDQVAGQMIAADVRTSRRTARDEVELITAHRTGGRQWDLVVVAGVQEGVWPSLTRHGGLLDVDCVGPDGVTGPATHAELIAEQRRLFYQACARARHRLLVTTVEDAHSDAGLPSRFVTELLREPVRVVRDDDTAPASGQASGVDTETETEAETGAAADTWGPASGLPVLPEAPAVAAHLVGELRHAGADPARSPLVRQAAADVLADLSAEVAMASPHQWWTSRERSAAPDPVVAPGEPVPLSGSAVQALQTCPRRWFLSRRAAGEHGSAEHAEVGTLVHDLVCRVDRAEIDPADLPDAFEEAWSGLTITPPWRAPGRREQVWTMIEAWLDWRAARGDVHLVGAEVPFTTDLAVPTPEGGTDTVRIRGVVDRLELVEDEVVVVDYKTGTAVSQREAATAPQLGIYQEAVRAGAFDHLGLTTRRPGTARFVHLTNPKGTARADERLQPSVEAVPVPDGVEVGSADNWVLAALGEAAHLIRTENFEARAGDQCRSCSFALDCPTNGVDA